MENADAGKMMKGKIITPRKITIYQFTERSEAR
jgi:hypothetical protein